MSLRAPRRRFHRSERPVEPARRGGSLDTGPRRHGRLHRQMLTLTDADLVERILDGDSEALAALYDRYADRIHTMCVHMLRDADDAADATAEVFLTAAERLAQLRDPTKLRPWLYAIARHEVYRRSRHRRRFTPVDAAELPPGIRDLPRSEDEAEAELDEGADPEALAALLQEGAAGLDDRDRMVLELHLTQGLDGQDLADALGVNVDHGYQLVHRMKERLERSMAALLVVRAGRGLCDGLDEVADRWDGTYSVLWRKRFARHLDRCERCRRIRARLPKAVLSGSALSAAAQAAVLAAPVAARERFLAEAPTRLAAPARRPWSEDGFPRDRNRSRRRWSLAAAAVLLALLAGGAVLSDEEAEVLRVAAPSTSAAAGPSPSAPTTAATTTSTSAPAVTTQSLPEPEQTTTTTVPASRGPATAPQAPLQVLPPPPPPTTTTTTVPDAPPTLSLSGPGCAPWGSSATYTATVTAPAGVSSVTLSWTGSSAGSVPMSGSGGTYTASIGMGPPMTGLDVSATVVDTRGRTASAGRFTTSGPSCT